MFVNQLWSIKKSGAVSICKNNFRYNNWMIIRVQVNYCVSLYLCSILCSCIGCIDCVTCRVSEKVSIECICVGMGKTKFKGKNSKKFNFFNLIIISLQAIKKHSHMLRNIDILMQWVYSLKIFSTATVVSCLQLVYVVFNLFQHFPYHRKNNSYFAQAGTAKSLELNELVYVKTCEYNGMNFLTLP